MSKEDKNFYIRVYPKSKEFKNEVVELAKKRQLSVSSLIIVLLQQELEKDKNK